MIKKILEPTGEVCIKFTEEELSELNIKENDKFSIENFENGILLKKYETIELEMKDLSREVLEFLITESCDKNIPVSEIIENTITSILKQYDGKNQLV